MKETKSCSVQLLQKVMYFGKILLEIEYGLVPVQNVV